MNKHKENIKYKVDGLIKNKGCLYNYLNNENSLSNHKKFIR